MNTSNHLPRQTLILVLLICLFSTIAALCGILCEGGSGSFVFKSIHGEDVVIYGKGVYHKMSAELAPQGIAQDFVTLLLGVPTLLISLMYARKGSASARIVLTGTVFYFLVTYTFFTLMAVFNQLFLIWVLLISLSFFTFLILIRTFEREELKQKLAEKYPSRFIGRFLIFNAVAIGLLWLSVVVPPVISGSYPKAVEHYTTLVVQALDLGILLPMSFVAGMMLIKRQAEGYLYATIYIVFLSFMMLALLAKIIAMAIAGSNVIPVVFIIPVFAFISIYGATTAIRIMNRSEK